MVSCEEAVGGDAVDAGGGIGGEGGGSGGKVSMAAFIALDAHTNGVFLDEGLRNRFLEKIAQLWCGP